MIHASKNKTKREDLKTGSIDNSSKFLFCFVLLGVGGMGADGRVWNPEEFFQIRDTGFFWCVDWYY